MNRVTKRSWLMGAFILLLLGGMGFFVAEYVFQADTWVVSTGSPHVYKGSNLGNGTVVDRNDVGLLDIDENRTYSDNAQTMAGGPVRQHPGQGCGPLRRHYGRL